ncbi:glutathione transferase GstA [Duganella sp. FT94W]|uniref:Glutathione transferase GstA n=1 Tax=Duganella lactea TaxID=2692173 RepID=A0ABW9V4Y8_9BURK|nr:glutathione transferase GstA [Duganella lactea]MYM34759.1 glutathione transferase GstA [Duganella lactea]
MKLYYAPHTCSLSPLIVLKELELPHQLIKVDNQTKHTADGRDFRAINPKGYVAALELDNGEVLTEGPAIIQYLADLKPSAGLAPPAGTWPRVRLQETLNFITSEIHAGVAPLFNRDLPESAQTIFRERLFRRMAVLEETLRERAYLLGAAYTVADAYLYTVLGWFSFFAIETSRWPAVAAYEQRIAQRPAVQAALQAHV